MDCKAHFRNINLLSRWPLAISHEMSGSDRFGSKIFDPGWVSHLWLGFRFGTFYLKTSIFSIFCASGGKNLFGPGQKVPGSKAGQKYARVGSDGIRDHLYYLGLVYFLGQTTMSGL